MSISINLRTGPQALSVPQETVQSMPEMMTTIFSYLQPDEVSSAERVQQSWHSMINSKDQYVWKEQCQTQGLLKSSSDVENVLKDVFNNDYSPKGTGSMASGPLSIIDGYDHDTNYKTLGSVIQGKVILDGQYVYSYDKSPLNDSLYHVLKWGTNDAEPFVQTLTYSDESEAACVAEHGEDCENLGRQASWQDIHPRVSKFPRLLPLRLFINPDGSYKQAGDKIKLLYQERPIILTCTNLHDLMGLAHDEPNALFATELAHTVDASITTAQVSQGSVNRARNAAQITQEWIRA